jgi:hypothetical protein
VLKQQFLFKYLPLVQMHFMLGLIHHEGGEWLCSATQEIKNQSFSAKASNRQLKPLLSLQKPQ